MIQRQQEGGNERPKFYAWCRCGVCGPPRWTSEGAKRDERAHAAVCSSKGARHAQA